MGRERVKKRLSGVTLLELLIVLIILAVGSVAVLPKFRKEIENREAKQALETVRMIAQAARMYKVDKGQGPANLAELEAAGYVDRNSYYKPSIFTYASVPPGGTIGWRFIARRADPGLPSYRLVAIRNNTNLVGPDEPVYDTAGILDS